MRTSSQKFAKRFIVFSVALLCSTAFVFISSWVIAYQLDLLPVESPNATNGPWNSHSGLKLCFALMVFLPFFSFLSSLLAFLLDHKGSSFFCFLFSLFLSVTLFLTHWPLIT